MIKSTSIDSSGFDDEYKLTNDTVISTKRSNDYKNGACFHICFLLLTCMFVCASQVCKAQFYLNYFLSIWPTVYSADFVGLTGQWNIEKRKQRNVDNSTKNLTSALIFFHSYLNIETSAPSISASLPSSSSLFFQTHFFFVF